VTMEDTKELSSSYIKTVTEGDESCRDVMDILFKTESMESLNSNSDIERSNDILNAISESLYATNSATVDMQALNPDLDIGCNNDMMNVADGLLNTQNNQDDTKSSHSCLNFEHGRNLRSQMSCSLDIESSEEKFSDLRDSSINAEGNKKNKYSLMNSDINKQLFHPSSWPVAESTNCDDDCVVKPCSDSQLHKCEQCGKSFKKKAWFDRHVQTHNGECWPLANY
jgi:hypothetical protein